jgi:hypothetical protein
MKRASQILIHKKMLNGEPACPAGRQAAVVTAKK